MVTTIMLMTVLTALVKAIIFSDNRTSKSFFFDTSLQLNVPKHYGIITFGPMYEDNEDIRISVDPDTLDVFANFEVESEIDAGCLDYIEITWDVQDPSSIGHDIFNIYKKVDTKGCANICEKRSEEIQIVEERIREVAKNMNNKIVNIKVDY